jgi:hypothetical protein
VAPVLADLRSRGRPIDPVEISPPAPRGSAPAVDSTTSPLGFRGLALRALGASDDARHRAVRLEPEPRPAPEARLDDLDARVVESLTRVLAREARRHGIDVTGARA